GSPARWRPHRAIAVAAPWIADHERSLRADQPAMQRVGDRNQVRSALQADGGTPRDGGEQGPHRIVNQARMRVGPAEQATAELPKIVLAWHRDAAFLCDVLRFNETTVRIRSFWV